MKSLNFLLIFLIISNLAAGQEKIYGFSGALHLGLKSYNTGNYQYFMPADAADLDNGLVTLGAGGHAIYKNWLVGTYGYFRSGDSQSLTVDGQMYDYRLTGSSGYLNLGYILFHGSSWLLYPQVGFGVENRSLVKTLDESIDFSVDENLSARYIYFSPMMEISFGFDFYPLGTSMTKFGLRLGYQFSLEQNNDWEHSGGVITGPDLPENNLNGFFVNLVIGGGYFVSR